MKIFQVGNYQFPYHDLTFPGQYSEERILFATREGKKMLYVRFGLILLSTLILVFVRYVIENKFIRPIFPQIAPTYSAVTFALILLFFTVAIWLVHTLWKKSVFVITTHRLTKFIHTTPWNRYQLSLGLDKIVDTGSYQKGFIQSFFGYGYFVARSSAGNIKNFKIVNISFHEDLHNYINKLLFTFSNHQEKLDSFRPFIPHLKGEARKKYVRKVAPQYYPKENE